MNLARAKDVEKAIKVHEKRQQEHADIKKVSRDARDEWRVADEKAIEARRELAEAEKLAARHQSEETALKDRLEHLLQDIKEQNVRYHAAIDNLENLPETVDLENEIAKNREIVDLKRGEFSEARIAHDSHYNQSEMRQNRLEQIKTEYDN